MKKDIYFNFGADDSYFLRCGAQHRSHGYIAGRDNTTWDQWVKFDCVVWHRNFYFSCRHNHDRVNQMKYENGGLTLKSWIDQRSRCPLRLVLGAAESTKSWFAWMVSGDHAAGVETPLGMKQAANDARKSYTSIRCAALGTNNTWLLLWEDGTMAYNLKNEYPGLDAALEDVDGEDISWIAINSYKPGDYFLYVDRAKTAVFQVSEAFGNDLEEVLYAEGIRSKAIVRRQQEVVRPTDIIKVAKRTNLLGTVANVTSIGASLFTVAASIAGFAVCNVM